MNKHLTVPETMQQMADWLDCGEPFFHTRYNDGEWNAMFHLYREQKLLGQNRYVPDLCDALAQTFDQLAERVTTDPSHILIGSVWDIAGTLPGGRLFIEYLSRHPEFRERARWVAGDTWYTIPDERSGIVDDKGLFRLFACLRNLHTVLVSNAHVALAHHCLNAATLLIPLPDAWTDADRITEEARMLAQTCDVFVWCGGLAVKPIAFQIWCEFPHTSHIDLGSVFDAVFAESFNGAFLRNWVIRKEAEGCGGHWRFVQNVLKPYVYSFIPPGKL